MKEIKMPRRSMDLSSCWPGMLVNGLLYQTGYLEGLQGPFLQAPRHFWY